LFSLDTSRVLRYANVMLDARGRDNCEAHGAVCFDRRDYAGPVRRVVIVCIDGLALLVLSFGVLIGIWYVWLVRYPKGDVPAEALWVVLAVAYLYLTMLKRSRVRTLGYILTGVRIVDIEGKKPSLLQMTTRLWPLLPVPWSFLFDLGWVLDEPQRQTLRDKWAGTFIVRRKAKPVGTAPVRYKRIGFAGIFLIFPEVDRTHQTSEP
jgi:uncharacterized RDD family membrane protein YckC